MDCIYYVLLSRPNRIAKGKRFNISSFLLCFFVCVLLLLSIVPWKTFKNPLHNKAHNISNQNRSTTSCRHWLRPTIVRSLHFSHVYLLFMGAVALKRLHFRCCFVFHWKRCLWTGSGARACSLILSSFIGKKIRNKQHINIMNESTTRER